METVNKIVREVGKQSSFTVGLAMKAFDRYRLESKLTDSHLVKLFSILSSENEAEINNKALKTKFYRLSKDVKSKKGSYKEKFLSTQFIIPVQTCQASAPDHGNEGDNINTYKTLIEEKEALCEKRKNELKQVQTKLEERRLVVKNLKEKNKQLNRKFFRLKRKMETQDEEKGHVKRLKKDSVILHREKVKIEKKYQTLQRVLKRMKSTKQCNKALGRKVINLQKQNTRINKQLSETEKAAAETLSVKEKVEEENVHLRKDLTDLHQSCDYLEDLLKEDQKVELYDYTINAFSSKTMECVMNLSNCNVAHHKIPEVITTVLALVNKEPNRLPRRSTVDSMISAKAAVTLKQLSNILLSKKNLTLYTDETRKFGKTYNTYIATDEEKEVYFLGLREMYNKSAQTAFDTLQDILQDLCDTVGDTEMNVGNKIVSNIVNTMSDRANTEKAFNDILELYRKNILPTVIDGWADLTPDQQEQLSAMHSFFCGLHLLVAFAEVSSKCLLEYEQTLKEKYIGLENEEDVRTEFQNASESATVRLIRASSKCLSRGGDEKSGCFADFQTYLSKLEKRVKFVRFHGNRFNIIFLLAEVLYNHREDVIAFFEKCHVPTNKLQKAVFLDVKEDILAAGCKVLGLLSKLVTAPLWRLLESGNHILEMNDHYLVLLQYLEKISKDPTGFMTGEDCCFNDQYIHKDAVFECLIEPNEKVDHYAEQISRTIAAALHSLIERMVADHLPGGKYSKVTEELKSKTASVVPHNKLPEFAFGVLDFQLRYRPNASTLVNEAFLMYSMNKTCDWLKTLSEDEKDNLMKECRRHGRKYRETFKLRCREIQERRRKLLDEKAAEAERKSEIQRKKREEIVQHILYDGLWQSEEQIDEGLGLIKSKKEKRESLIWQLKFRKVILQQTYKDKTVFNFSRKGGSGKYVDLNVTELKENLKRLLDESLRGPCSERSNKGIPLLVGKKIKHKFEEKTYMGRVISVVPGYPDWYNVVYDNDTAVYTYRLLEDYRKNDLTIIPEAGLQEVFRESLFYQFQFKIPPEIVHVHCKHGARSLFKAVYL